MTTIAAERAALTRVGRPLILREAAGLTFDYTGARAVTEPATRVFVHITVTNPSAYNSDAAHWRAVEAIGRARFPATGISYNRGHMRSGRAYEGQPVGRRGAHTVNDYRRSACTQPGCPGRGGPLTAPDWNLNYNSRSYVICQNVGHDVPAAMLDSVARSIAADKLVGFVTRDAEIHGHLCVANKACPGAPMWRLMGALADKVDHYLRHGFTDEEDDVLTGTQAEQLEDASRPWAHTFGTQPDGSEFTAGEMLAETRGHARAANAKADENAAAIAALAASVAELKAILEGQ